MTSAEKLEKIVGTPRGGGTSQVIVSDTVIQLQKKQIKMVTLKADKSNTDAVYIGFDDNVNASTGFPLDPGESIDIVIDDLSKIYLIASEIAQKVYILWVQ